MCSLSVSQKLSGTHIGNKGIGFKSSFLCTNNPIIISKPAWKFQFILNENNMLSYITPRLIHDDDLSDVLKTYLENNNCYLIKHMINTLVIYIMIYKLHIEKKGS